jgi:hypothetical protein
MYKRGIKLILKGSTHDWKGRTIFWELTSDNERVAIVRGAPNTRKVN